MLKKGSELVPYQNKEQMISFYKLNITFNYYIFVSAKRVYSRCYVFYIIKYHSMLCLMKLFLINKTDEENW